MYEEFAIPRVDRDEFAGESPLPNQSHEDLAAFYHRFSQDLLAMEHRDRSAKMLLRELFAPHFSFPPATTMSAEKLASKVRDIRETLEKNGMVLNICKGVPNPALYQFLKQKVFSQKIPRNHSAGHYRHSIGCDWDCPNCFQRDYCLTGSGNSTYWE